MVRVIPRCSKSEIVGEHDCALKIKLASPPVDGAANDELIELLAKAFDVPKGAVEIVSGHGSKTKSIRITEASPDKIAAVLQKKT